jgi:hypothetical protein
MMKMIIQLSYKYLSIYLNFVFYCLFYNKFILLFKQKKNLTIKSLFTFLNNKTIEQKINLRFIIK